MRPERRGDTHLRIHGWRGAADIGLQVAAAAAVEIEARPQPVAHAFRFLEVFAARIEERRPRSV